MNLKKKILLFILVFFIPSCGTLDSVKRGITGEKQKSTDEFLVKKKDPLILPPDYENLPSPTERKVAKEEFSITKTLTEETSIKKNSGSSSTEESILKRIKEN
tara:strand:- start:280 stop:588 length:309 start_codon:yes stop_codon:yes gene_type:complete